MWPHVHNILQVVVQPLMMLWVTMKWQVCLCWCFTPMYLSNIIFAVSCNILTIHICLLVAVLNFPSSNQYTGRIQSIPWSQYFLYLFALLILAWPCPMVGISQAYSPPINQPYTPHSSAHQAVVVHNITLYGCPWQSQSRCSQSCITCILQKLAYYGNSSIRCVVNDLVCELLHMLSNMTYAWQFPCYSCLQFRS